jgi:HK97 family phage portal protein
LGLFSKLFKFIKVRYVYSGTSSRSAPFNKEAYEQEIVRAVIDCIATHAAKAEAMHVILDKDGRIKEIKRNSPYVKLLNQRPNPLMTGFDLKYKLVTHVETNTTALCYIKWNGTLPEMMIPIQYDNFEILPIDGGGYAVQFIDYDGIQRALNIEDVVILRKFFNAKDVGGDGNDPIYNTLDMMKASNEGLMQALSVSNKVRGLLKQKKAMLSPEDVTKATDEFTARFEKAAKEGGIVGVDSMEEYAPLNVTPWSANAAQMKEIRENILRYWRMSNTILTSDYTESQWQAFYESVVEPRLIQMGQAFTNVCFTQRERDSGNRIIFNSSVLLNTAMQTKVNILNAAKEIGLFTKNEIREMFGYAPIEGGDEAQVSLNYVKATDQSKYQTGEEMEVQDGKDKDD